jgi:hypothetical protein
MPVMQERAIRAARAHDYLSQRGSVASSKIACHRSEGRCRELMDYRFLAEHSAGKWAGMPP